MLKELSLLKPLPDSGEEVFHLNEIDSFSDLSVNIIVTLGKADLKNYAGFFQLRKIDENKYMANLVYEKTLDEKFAEDQFSSVRKLAILHEYLHLVAFIELLETQPREIEAIFKEKNKNRVKVIEFNEIVSLLQSIGKRDMKNTAFRNEHFRYFDGDQNLYNQILINLLLPRYAMEKCAADQNTDFPINEAVNDPKLLATWIKDTFQSCLVHQKIQVNQGSAGLLTERFLAFIIQKLVELKTK